MARVRVDALHDGMELASDVLSNTGQVLVRSGTELSEREIRLFNMWGISDIEIEGDEGELAESVAALDPALLAKYESDAKSLFRHAKIDHPFMAPLFRECVSRCGSSRERESNEGYLVESPALQVHCRAAQRLDGHRVAPVDLHPPHRGHERSA